MPIFYSCIARLADRLWRRTTRLEVAQHLAPIVPLVVPTGTAARTRNPSLLPAIGLELLVRHDLAQIIHVGGEVVLLNVKALQRRDLDERLGGREEQLIIEDGQRA